MFTVDPKQLGAFLRAAEASNDAVTELAVPAGGLLRFRKHVSESVSSQLEEVSATGETRVAQRIFLPAPSRPTGYPAAAPFLPGLETMVADYPNGLLVAWDDVPDPDASLDALVTSSVADGWVEDPPSAIAKAAWMGMRMRALRKGDRQRVFNAMHWPKSTLSCIEGMAGRELSGTPR